MLKRIIRMAAVLLTLLPAGCVRTLDPAVETAEIRFDAGSMLLRDDATRTGTPKTGTAFDVNDAFVAWAWHYATQQHFSFGTQTPVTLGAGGLWDYAPHQFWNWQEGADFYDFLAIYPAGKPITHQAATLLQPNLKASVSYNATSDQYDLMAAGTRRNDKSITPVPLTFNHMLSAVSVDVLNAEGSMDNLGNPLTVTLKSCKFVNLQTSASVTVTFNGTTLDVQRPGDRSEVPVLGPAIPASTTIAPGAHFPTTDEWDLMIPQDLNPEGTLPALQVVFNKGDATDVTETLELRAIKTTDTNEPITEWRAGTKYHYRIELRIGVGIVVTVTTTPWEVVEAQTPGLMI